MANDIILRRRLSPASFTLNIAMNGIPAASDTESIAGDVYWRWESDPTMEPQYLGQQTVGKTLAVPFDLKGQAIRLFLVSRTAEGDFSVRDIKEASQYVYTPAADLSEAVLTASENLAAGDLVNVWNDSSEPSARKADASDNTKPAHGFVTDTVTATNPVTVYFSGRIDGLGSVTPGATQYLSETAGLTTETAPTGSGKIVQQVGVAVGDNSIVFAPQMPIELE